MGTMYFRAYRCIWGRVQGVGQNQYKTPDMLVFVIQEHCNFLKNGLHSDLYKRTILITGSGHPKNQRVRKVNASAMTKWRPNRLGDLMAT